MAPALNTHRRPFNTRGRGRGRGRPRLYGRGGSMMGSRATHGSSTQAQPTNGAEQLFTPSRRGRGSNFTNGERRTSGLTFIRDISAIMGDPSAPGYKPREERSYLEFHPDLDVGMALRVMSAEDVDGDNYRPPTLPSAEAVPEPQNTSSASQQDSGAHTMLPIRTASDAQPPPTPGLEHIPSIFDSDDLVVSDLVQPVTPASRPSRLAATTGRRGGPGRPPKTPKPPPPKPPAEVLNLPKPSYRLRPNFNFSPAHAIANPTSLSIGSQQPAGAPDAVMNSPMHQQHRTTKTMVNVGYQDSEYWTRPKHMVRDLGGFYADDLSSSAVIIKGDKKEDVSSTTSSIQPAAAEVSGGVAGFGAEGERVEYDMDEQDDKWLTEYNASRRLLEVEPIMREMFEITMTKIEKEWCALEKQIPKKPSGPKTPHPGHFHRNGNDGEEEGAEDSKCAICDDGECENSNAIVFCDGCDLAVHQDCYGVPYIPEGQWLCRKCLNNPKQIVNCILCPNVDGAFKQTVSNAWAHLLCAIWIPEVVISNQVFMEPIDGIEDIPKQRWKLTCYICRQRMGACIQCSNKNCFIAFHVTCARRARLFLKMKSSGGGLEFSHLKGFCDRHVPADWRRENDVENAIVDAQDFYATTLCDSMWREGQLSGSGKAPELQSYDNHELAPGNGEHSSTTVTAGLHQGSPPAHTTAARRRKAQPVQTKIVWKLPSGAPIIPQIVFNAVCDSIARFGVRKRKEYVAEVCKYWTLKREARRGAALIKRLQLPESSSELTRRNWKALSQGRKKLQRRLEFAAKLRIDVEKLRMLADDAKRREKEKWRIVEMMREYVEKVYFPEVPLMQPILERAQLLDKGEHFKLGFSILGGRLREKIYATIDAFYTDLTTMLQSPPLEPKFAYIFPPELGIAGPNLKPFTGQLPSTDEDSATDVQVQRTANRILKAIAPLVEEAKKKEDELKSNPFAEAAKELEDRFEKEREKARTASRTPISPIMTNVLGDRMDMDVDVKDEAPSDHADTIPVLLECSEPTAQESEKMDVDADPEGDEDLDADGEYEEDDISLPQPIPDGRTTNSTVLFKGREEVQPSGPINGASGSPSHARTATNHANSRLESENKLSMPSSSNLVTTAIPSSPAPDSDAQSSSNGKTTAPLSFPMLSAAQWNGKHPPWYLQEFDPRGLVLHEERWLGRDIARESSPLSELSEDEMLGLVGEVGDEGSSGLVSTQFAPTEHNAGNSSMEGYRDSESTGDFVDADTLYKAEGSFRGRKGTIRGRSRRGRWRARGGRGRGPIVRGSSRVAEVDTECDSEEYQETDAFDDGPGADEQLRMEGLDLPLPDRHTPRPQSEHNPHHLVRNREDNITTHPHIKAQTNGPSNDDMDIDPPQLPCLPIQERLNEAPQTPRTSSLSPLTSVVPEFDSSPLSNAPTQISQPGQSPTRHREASASSIAGENDGHLEDDDDDDENSTQQNSPNTTQRRSRKNMVFARQSNGRFGSNKAGGPVVNSGSIRRKKTKRWI